MSLQAAVLCNGKRVTVHSSLRPVELLSQMVDLLKMCVPTLVEYVQVQTSVYVIFRDHSVFNHVTSAQMPRG